MNPISSLHVVHSFDNRQGGVVHSALSTAKYLIEAGHPAEVVASFAADDEVEYLKESFPTVPHHRIPRAFPSRNHNAPGLDAWLNREHSRFDIIQLHSVWTGTSARAGRFCRRVGKPYVVCIQNSLDPFDLAKRSLLKRILGPFYVRPLLDGALGVICTTELESSRLITFGANPPRFIVPLAVPTIGGGGMTGPEFRRAHGIPDSALVVLFLSRFDVKKGLQFLIPALARLKGSFPDLWFLLAGAGEPGFAAKINQMLDSAQMRSWTTLPGFISGGLKRSAFAASNIFALPSLNENFGMVVVEAMQNGVPALISDQVFLYPTLERAGAAVICQPNLDSCEMALRKMMSGQVNLAEIIRCGRTMAEGEFSPTVATKKLISCYQDVLAHSRP